jgi:hypothetical protein
MCSGGRKWDTDVVGNGTRSPAHFEGDGFLGAENVALTDKILPWTIAVEIEAGEESKCFAGMPAYRLTLSSDDFPAMGPVAYLSQER